MAERESIGPALVALTVVGSGSGEAIIVNFNNESVLLVDCAQSLSESKASNPLGDAISKSHSQKLDCLLLTHPHLDHYSGMAKVLETHGEKLHRAFLFNGLTESELVSAYERDAGVGAESTAAYRYYKTYGRVRKAWESLSPRQRYDASDRTLISEFLVGSGRGQESCRVIALSPSQVDARRFLRQARISSLRELSEGLGGPPSQACNDVSVVLLIEFGETRILLGADAETRSWGQILEKNTIEDLECNIFKVSHHGSTNGFPVDLLGSLAKPSSRGEDTVALLTPSARHGLPEYSVLAALREAFGEVEISARRLAPKAVDVGTLSAHFPDLNSARAKHRWRRKDIALVFDGSGRRLTRDLWPSWFQGSQESHRLGPQEQ